MIARTIAFTVALLATASLAQGVAGSFAQDLRVYVETAAPTGYEHPLAAHIAAQLKTLAPQIDSMGNVLVTIGSGSPHRLLVAPLDEPGYAVSGIDSDGYLRLQRLPTRANLPLFNELYSAEPVEIGTRSGGWIAGVVAGLSVHLQPGRVNPPNPDDIDNMYVDVGAPTAEAAREAGVDILSPVELDRTLYAMGNGMLTAPAIGDRFGTAAAVEILRRLQPARLQGTLTVAFVTEQWSGERGLARVLDEFTPDEILYLGRDQPAGGGRGRGAAGAAAEPTATAPAPGSGVLISGAPGAIAPFTVLAQQRGIALLPAVAASFLPAADARGDSAQIAVHLSVPVAWPATPAEMLSGNDVAGMIALVEAHLGLDPATPALPDSAALPEPSLPARPAAAPTPTAILMQMVRPYAVHPNDAPSGDMVKRLLPPWAKPVTDAAGNIILHWGPGGASAPGPHTVLFVAHQDEIGYDVQSIGDDGTLTLRSRGGGDADYYIGHPMLVHTATGMRPGVTELPQGWREPGFRLTAGRGGVRMDVGARSTADATTLGIQVGDTVTIPKAYRNLLDGRATARSFDDRVGCSALIAAAWALGPSVPGRDITFAWSTGEETGLEGATALAKRLAAAHQTPAYVFAIDTFVSSDSPLESHRFADAAIGQGFVVRAIDDSNLIPWNLSRKAVALANGAHIPVQYGATGGGNDGSAFLPFGAIDVPLGWPLRYSHSPGEVIDLRDLNGLSHMVTAIAREW